MNLYFKFINIYLNIFLYFISFLNITLSILLDYKIIYLIFNLLNIKNIYIYIYADTNVSFFPIQLL